VAQHPSTESAYLMKRGLVQAVKRAGNMVNPQTAWFQGSNVDPDDFDATDQGLTRAYIASLWASRCINIRGKRLSAIPLMVKTQDDEYVDREGRPTTERVSSYTRQHILQKLVGAGFKRTLRQVEYDLCIFGRAFAEPTQRGIMRLNPLTMEVVKDSTYGVDYFRQSVDGRTTATWEPDKLLYFYDYDPNDDFNGLSPLSFALRAAAVEVSVADFVEGFFENDATPAGLLSTKDSITEADIVSTAKWWQKLFGGSKNKHKIGVVGGGLEYQQIGSDIGNLALDALRLEVRREMTAAFGVPMTLAGADEAANYSTSKEQHVAFYTETILPELEMIVDVLNDQLVPKFDRNLKIVAEISGIDVLQEDKNEIANRAFSGYTNGVYTLNESRDLVGQPPQDEDYILIPNVGPVRVTDLPKLADAAVNGNPKVYGETGGMYNPEKTDPPDPTGGDGDPSAAPASPFGQAPRAAVPAAPGEPPDPNRPSMVMPARPTPRRFAVGKIQRRPDGQRPLRSAQTTAPPVENASTPLSGAQASIGDWTSIRQEAALVDLKRWHKKVRSKGIKAAFHSAAIPTSIQTFLRWDMQAAGEDQAVIKRAFNRAEDALKSTDPTPEEFEAYWNGIDEAAEMLLEQVGTALDNPDLRARLASRIEATGDHKAVQDFFDELTDDQVAQLVGTLTEPGPLTQIFLAGAARGQELHDRLVKQNTPPAPMRAAQTTRLPVAWNLINQDALNYATNYAYRLVRGINQTTTGAFQESMDDWINRGGSLPGLIDLIHGRLKGLDIPAGWSSAKIDWATSRQRARLIAQTESTRVFTEGNVRRWHQLGVKQIKWRTQNDREVCVVCKALGKEPWNIASVDIGFTIPPQFQGRVGRNVIKRPPLHPGCRCFPAPVTASRVQPLEAVAAPVGPRRKPAEGLAVG
jgi:HK97 family phage portal protein